MLNIVFHNVIWGHKFYGRDLKTISLYIW
jgi:hypothetical protein